VVYATASWSELPFRPLVSDPFDLALRAVNTSINTLTIRHDRASGRASFFLLYSGGIRLRLLRGAVNIVSFRQGSSSQQAFLLTACCQI
jgi:hypothetical protein